MQTSTFIKAIPLCCLFLAAADQRDCTIHVVVDNGGEGEGEGQNGGEGEGEGQNGGDCNADTDCGPGQKCIVETECAPCNDPTGACPDNCRLVGTCVDDNGGECQVDSDCGAGQVCELEANCPPCNDSDPACEAPCTVDGKCVDAQPGCTSDSDCGSGSFCDFSQCGNTDANGNDRPIACNAGICEPLPPPPPQCSSDADCGPGFACESVCADGSTGNGNGSDQPAPAPPPPDCQNICVENGGGVCNILCSPGEECVINADGSEQCVPVNGDPPNCTSDTDCNGGSCNAADVCQPDPSCDATTNSRPDGTACTDVCWGWCTYNNGGDCNVDSDCSDGLKCVLTTQCPPCADPTNGGPQCDIACLEVGTCVAQDPPPPQP